MLSQAVVPGAKTLGAATPPQGARVAAATASSEPLEHLASGALASTLARTCPAAVALTRKTGDPVALGKTVSADTNRVIAVSTSRFAATMAPERAAAVSTPAAPMSAPDSAQVKQASLVWSGDADTRLDPQSLAAIQSFMTPKAAGGGPSVRDELNAALSGIACSRLTATFSPGAGWIEVRGHARDAVTVADAVARVAEAVGSSIPVVGNLLVLPEPQCAVLDAIEALGLPQSTSQANDPLVVGRAAQARYLALEDGEPMVFDLEAADYDAYLYVDYFDAEGQVTHLMPNEYAPLRVHPAGRRFSIGGGDVDGSGVRLTIMPPFGKDIVVVIATTHRLYQDERPRSEDGAVYLAEMRGRIAAIEASQPDFHGEWVYMFLETFPLGERPAR